MPFTPGRPAAMTVVFVLLAGTAMAQPSGSEARTIEGTWFVDVTPRNCESGAPVGPVVHSLVTFHHGGTLNESPATPTMAPGQRTPGQGLWRHDAGRTYYQHFAAHIVFSTPPGAGSPGFEAGWQTVTHTVQLLEDGTLESSGGNAFYRLDGTLYRAGCSSAVGRRLPRP